MAPVRCATPGTEVDCATQPWRLGQLDDPVGQHAAALAAHRDDRDRDRPLGRIAAAGRRQPDRLVRSCQRLEREPPAVAAPLQPADHAHRDRRLEHVPAARIVDDVGAIERGAEHRGFRDLAAIAAADAGIVDRRNGIVAQRIVELLHRQRRAAGEPDAGMVAGADVLVDAEALA